LEPSYLFYAIEQGKEDIAVLLASRPWIDPQFSGYRTHSIKPGQERITATPLELAEKKGLTRVAEVLRERLKPLQVENDKETAENLSLRAADLRAQAEQLEREAAKLSSPSAKPAKKKLNI